jgi:hypothetical protein
MPIGKGRKQPPLGYMTPKEAGDKLGHSRLYKLVQKKAIQRVIPPGYTHGYYVESEVNTLYQAEQIFFNAEKAESKKDMQEAIEQEEAIFALATQDDMDALYTMAVKLFPHTASADLRRTWLAKEPQGHYIIKTRDGRVLAYLYLLALKRDRPDVSEPDRMKMYLHRQLTSSMITSDDINPLIPGVATDIAIAGIGSDPDISQELRTSYTSWLLYGVSRDLERMGREGILLNRAYAFSETHDGITMCTKLGMQQWEPPQGKVCTFVSDVQGSAAFLFKRYRRGLAEWQATHTTPRRIAQPTPQPQAVHYAAPRTQVTAPGDLPPGTLHIQDFLQRHGLKPYRRKIVGYMDTPSNNLHSHTYPKPHRSDETDRFLTPEQQEVLLAWLKAKHPDLFA